MLFEENATAGAVRRPEPRVQGFSNKDNCNTMPFLVMRRPKPCFLGREPPPPLELSSCAVQQARAAKRVAARPGQEKKHWNNALLLLPDGTQMLPQSGISHNSETSSSRKCLVHGVQSSSSWLFCSLPVDHAVGIRKTICSFSQFSRG